MKIQVKKSEETETRLLQPGETVLAAMSPGGPKFIFLKKAKGPFTSSSIYRLDEDGLRHITHASAVLYGIQPVKTLVVEV